MKKVLIAVDQLINTLLGLVPRLRSFGFGNPDETISSRLGKLEEAGNPYAATACKYIGYLPWFTAGHCRRAIERDEK